MRLFFAPTVFVIVLSCRASAVDPDLKELAVQIEKGTKNSKLKALEEAGAQGAKAKLLLRPIATAMLNRDKDVKIAATDAMKKIDDHVEAIAVKLLIQFEQVELVELMKEGKEVIDPLVPLLLNNYERLLDSRPQNGATLTKMQLILDCLYVNVPDDPGANAAILKALKSPHIQLQHTGVIASRLIKDGKKGLQDVMRIAKVCPNEGIRVLAVSTIPYLLDENRRIQAGLAALFGQAATTPIWSDEVNRKLALKSLKELRLDTTEAVRDAAGRAIELIEKP